MNDQTYNGWTNYATWRVNLEVFDGLNLRDHFDELPDEASVAEWAQSWADELLDDAMPGYGNNRDSYPRPSCDLVDGWARVFLAGVDWHMIARHLIDDASEVDA